tara:strand:+ start:5338 stop:6588 length:1251 start_codon:yes stop_codon:yes gene_type:complete
MTHIRKSAVTDTILTWHTKFNDLVRFTGDSSDLTTDQDSDLVGAINEIDAVFDASANKILTNIETLNLLPTVDDTSDLGSAAKEWKDLYVDGVANIDYGLIDSATITGNLNIGGKIIDLRADSATVSGVMTATTFSGAGTSLTGTGASFTAGNVTTNANLTGPITSGGNATSVAAQTGTGSVFVMNTSPSLITPALGTPASGVATNITGLPAASVLAGTLGAGAYTISGDLSVDNLNFNGNTISGSGSLTLDATTDIILDAGGADVLLKDDATQFGALTNTSGNLIIKSGSTTAMTFSGADVTLAGSMAPPGGLSTTANDFKGAINELKTAVDLLDSSAIVSASWIGTYDDIAGASFTTDSASSKVPHLLNELANRSGLLSALSTTASGTLVAAINELKGKIINVYDSAGSLLSGY